ncbi:hypothetical protein BS78_K237800 [Paspalum vaginatum]|uniref:F-box domain-containing protein n=1 Tax=Paspalum vaginatum TaxID=158149 RepID=A0A9W8CG82_9POAL|nr:hypothetical protein BS78_K237800 [Paspalum vaginatum]
MGTPEQTGRTQGPDPVKGGESSCSAAEVKDESHCAERIGSHVQLPEDMLHQIHALMPMRDAAQAACVSRAFLRSWRCYPKLILSVDSLGHLLIAPNLQTLFLTTCDETVNTPVAFGKFLQLRYLEIMLSAPNFSPDFDFCSLVSFLDASPALETLILRIGLPTIRHDSIVEAPDGDSSQPRRFANIDRCWPLTEEALVEAQKARVAIQRHIVGRVPPAVNLKVIEPCSKCTRR